LILVAYTFLTFTILLIGYGAYSGIDNPYYYIFLFSANGIFQSVGWPSNVSILNNWFGKRGRGTFFGLWASTGATGNIIGAVVTSVCTSSFNFEWYSAYSLMASFSLLMVIINVFLMISHPEQIDLHIEEFDNEYIEKE
jgi:sugar phosphate permease